MKKHLIIFGATSLLSMSSVSAVDMYSRIGAGAYWDFVNKKIRTDVSKDTSVDASYPLIPNAYIEAGANVTDSLRAGVEASGSLNSVNVKVKRKSTDNKSAWSTTEMNTSELKNHFSVCAKVTYDLKISDSIIPFIGAKVGYAHGIIGMTDEAIKATKGNPTEDIKKALKELLKLSPITAGATIGIGYKFTDALQLDVSYNFDYYKFVLSDLTLADLTDDAAKKEMQDRFEGSVITHKLSAGLTFRF